MISTFQPGFQEVTNSFDNAPHLAVRACGNASYQISSAEECRLLASNLLSSSSLAKADNICIRRFPGLSIVNTRHTQSLVLQMRAFGVSSSRRDWVHTTSLTRPPILPPEFVSPRRIPPVCYYCNYSWSSIVVFTAHLCRIDFVTQMFLWRYPLLYGVVMRVTHPTPPTVICTEIVSKEVLARLSVLKAKNLCSAK